MQVSQTWRYPLKSAQGESVARTLVGALGLEWDRQLAVVDTATGRALTARREPKLLMLSASVAGERDPGVLKTVLRERDGFLGVGALVVRPGQLGLGEEVTDLGPATTGRRAGQAR